MRSIRLILSALRPIRFLVSICVCTLLVFSNALPAFSDPVNPTASRSAPQQGEAQLRGIEREAQEAVIEKPYSREKTQAKANEGLNEIQGTANIENMKRPENAQADSVEDKSKNFIDALVGKKDIREMAR
jgi:hypothetical protein